MTSTPVAEPSPAPAKKFPGNFWVINAIEMGERLAYNNLRVVAPIYIAQATDNIGGLHLTPGDKGTIYAWWAIVQSLLPIFTGGLADRFGFKRTLSFAIPTIMIGYVLLAVLRDLAWANTLAHHVLPLLQSCREIGAVDWVFGHIFSVEAVPDDPSLLAGRANRLANYWLLFISITVMAAGTAFFKPGLQGALAKTLTKENSSMGWGVFYWVVNVGAVVGHIIPGILLAGAIFGVGPNSAEAWRHVFLASAAITGLNLIGLCRFKDVPSGAQANEPFFSVMKRTALNLLEPRLLFFLTIMSGFWLMMFQLWDLQPNFIADWLDSSSQAGWLQQNLPAWLVTSVVHETARGPMVLQNMLLGFNSVYIICGVVLASWLTRKMRTLSAMLIGMSTATAGILIAGGTMNMWWLVFGILCFSIGEMTIGPKKLEYLSLIAPKEKKGLYLGYANIPAGMGILFGSLIAGFVYGRYGEKAVLALKYLAEKTDFAAGKTWDGKVASLETFIGVPRSEAMTTLQTHLSLTPQEATQLLWNTYNPHLHVWIPFAAIGVVSAIALFVFARMARRWKDMDA